MLLDEPLRAWGLEEQETEGPFVHDSLTFISPDSLEGVTDFPSELSSDKTLKFQFGSQHLMYLQSHVVSVYSLKKWFKEHRAQRAPCD